MPQAVAHGTDLNLSHPLGREVERAGVMPQVMNLQQFLSKVQIADVADIKQTLAAGEKI